MGLSATYLDSPEDLGILWIAFCPREIMLFQWCAFALQGNDWAFIAVSCPLFTSQNSAKKREKQKNCPPNPDSPQISSRVCGYFQDYDHRKTITTTMTTTFIAVALLPVGCGGGPGHPTIFDAFSPLILAIMLPLTGQAICLATTVGWRDWVILVKPRHETVNKNTKERELFQGYTYIYYRESICSRDPPEKKKKKRLLGDPFFAMVAIFGGRVSQQSIKVSSNFVANKNHR